MNDEKKDANGRDSVQILDRTIYPCPVTFVANNQTYRDETKIIDLKASRVKTPPPIINSMIERIPATEKTPVLVKTNTPVKSPPVVKAPTPVIPAYNCRIKNWPPFEKQPELGNMIKKEKSPRFNGGRMVRFNDFNMENPNLDLFYKEPGKIVVHGTPVKNFRYGLEWMRDENEHEYRCIPGKNSV